ncbi:hypothetical protein VN12_19995 [Pirellula sp. SH-Sr6A]|uniref:DUF2314 domain-containing protein n=1 Tax=Pirellula sp. SH-Sr6A TaxID=1632865 RepID=UPI00078E74DC|nr:DUF2314 domain-containing protein [Pirellula sp. SH-Sr6A]AMV34417.1 hypothetical protein VN12_19995 [Pirellula sp. SH-Sr6A]
MNVEPESDELVPVFMPALILLLGHAEDKKGSPLSKDEVHSIRDSGTCIMMDVGDARKMDGARGYSDIDPENCWHDWQMARREMGRKTDMDPGPRFDFVQSNDPAYQQTIRDAQESIGQFRTMLPSDGSARPDALIKTKLVDGNNSAFMWLNNTATEGDNFSAELFEVPDTLPNYAIGDRYVVALDEVTDWMVNENGRLTGGFSIRYHRDRMTESEKLNLDRHIGVTDYA